MEIRPLPRKPKRKAGESRPRSWKYSPLVDDRAPRCRAHLWRLGPDFRELERVVDRAGQPVVLDGYARTHALQAVIHEPGFYRVVLRDRRGHIRARRDYQADFHFSSDWDPKTARRGFRPQTPMERLAAERDRLRASLRAAEGARDAFEVERDAALSRIAEMEQSAAMHINAVREEAARRIAEVKRDRDGLEALLGRKVAELSRVRALYVALADGDDGLGEVEARDAEASDERLALERLAETMLGYGERLGVFGGGGRRARGAGDDEDVDGALAVDADVCGYLRIQARTLRNLLRDSHRGAIDVPAVGRRKLRRWTGGPEAWAGWLEEVTAWRATGGGRGGSRSAGATWRARSAATRCRACGPRGRSSAR